MKGKKGRPSTSRTLSPRAPIVLLLLALVWLAGCTGDDPSDRPVRESVHTALGEVRGASSAAGVRTFLGIPYAQPPTGERRWRAPQPAVPWDEPLMATAYGSIAPQPPPSPLLAAFTRESARTMDEDCLTLNVWTAAERTTDGLPAMVWIHGGALVSGSGSSALYDGAALAERGVVVVTLNYRLGSLGFLAHPALSRESGGASGNYGLLDQILALRWVQENVGAFGGDPQNVTVFGESAGGLSIAALMTSSEAKGLFHKAIVESGAAPAILRDLDTDVEGLASAEALGAEAADSLLGANTDPASDRALAAVRALPWERLLEGSQEATAGVAGLPSAPVGRYLILDGRALAEPPGVVFAEGRQARIPLLVGTVADEGSLFAQSAGLGDEAAFLALVERLFGPDSEEVLGLYPAASGQSAASAAALIGDALFQLEARRLAEWTADEQLPVYRYVFARTIPLAQATGLGAFHGSEIPYVFGSLAGIPGFAAEDAALSDLVMGYWVRFAQTGDPNGEGAPRWDPYDPGRDDVMVLDVAPHMQEGYRQERLDLLERTFRLQALALE